MESKCSAESRTGLCFPRLLRKVSELRQNNKKPLQKHARKSQKADTIRGLRGTHSPHPLQTLKESKNKSRGASSPDGFETVAVADLRTGLSQQFCEGPGAETVGAQKLHLSSENIVAWEVGQSLST